MMRRMRRGNDRGNIEARFHWIFAAGITSLLVIRVTFVAAEHTRSAATGTLVGGNVASNMVVTSLGIRQRLTGVPLNGTLVARNVTESVVGVHSPIILQRVALGIIIVIIRIVCIWTSTLHCWGCHGMHTHYSLTGAPSRD